MVGRIGRSGQFDRLRAHGHTVRAGRLRVRWCSPDDDGAEPEAAMAWSVGRGHGSAVRRNRVRRRLRAAAAMAEAEGRLPRKWYLVTVLPAVGEPSFAELRTWLDAALMRVAQAGSGEDERGSGGAG